MARIYFFAFLTLSILIFSGCETTNQKPRVIEREQGKIDYAKSILGQKSRTEAKDLKKMELESQKEIARIEMQKAIEVERVKAEAKKAEIQSRKEIELKKAELKKSEIEKERSENSLFVIVTVLFLAVLSTLLYRLFREHQRTKLQLHKERMAHEANMKEKELQAKIVEKLIEAAGSGKLTPEQHERLMNSLHNRQIPYR
ncbi:hypothetical protein NNO_0006 [Hydrogenimonas sp.]|nr:hypothetical protein NNO_0006 [Hydrogenimonas sp.]